MLMIGIRQFFTRQNFPNPEFVKILRHTVVLFGIEPPVPIESFMLCETVYAYGTTIYAYGTEKHTIRIWYVPYAYGMYHTRMV